MESHEWNERTDEGKRYFRGNFRAGAWIILTTTMKRNPVWETMENPDVEVWQTLREVVFKKYQRKRCPWERVAELDRIIAEAGGAPES